MKFRFYSYPAILTITLLFFYGFQKRSSIRKIFPNERNTTILVSLDGFRSEYLDSFYTPNLDKIIDRGLKADALIPVFPTKTFPNHYTIVTGLYPSHHGIVGNKMFDPSTDQWFAIGAGSEATRQSFWFEGEPIWVTAKKQGVPSATLYWPGSDATPDSLKPAFHYYYDQRITYEARIKQAAEWLQITGDPKPGLITLYFESPDKEGHAHGPFSRQTKKAVQQVDSLIGDLVQRIQSLGMQNKVNLLITSDHGMTQLHPDSIIFIDDYIDIDDVTLVETSPKADIIPKPGKDSLVFNQLSGVHPRMMVYRKGDEPERWHYRDHPRITPIMALADPGWSITTRRDYATRKKALSGGAHGYDNANHQMWAIFIAAGPDFRPGLKIKPIENIHLYELMCHLLKITPSNNDGSMDCFKGLLRNY